MGADRIRALGIRVHGRVQGVYFRASAQRKAMELGLSGTVQNEHGGSVYMEVEGHEDQIQDMLTWCAEGPPMAVVHKLETRELPLSQKADFQIIR